MRGLLHPAFALALGLAWAGGAAMAAEAQAPDALPGLTAGVVGSGDQLSLQLKAEGGEGRLLKIGDPYQDGWVLSALTPSTATLTREGVSRTVGLNPTGALATASKEPPSKVQLAASALPPEVIEVLAMSDEEVIARSPIAQQMLALPVRGLTAEESRQYRMMSLRQNLFGPVLQKRMNDQILAARAAGINAQPATSSERFMLPAFGQAYADLWYKTNAALMADWQARTDNIRAAGGPEWVRVPPNSPSPGDPLAYIEVERDAAGAVYRLHDQPPLPPLDQVFPGSTPSVAELTPQMLEGMVGTDGAPVDAATRAAILAKNAQDRAAEAARLAAINDPSIQYYGLYGPVERRAWRRPKRWPQCLQRCA